uniref:Uncharacterized protein AlNc14C103G6112 n=1 Tax=Albugo laibachii Nc14 TaxID=890382 RepID=F0WHQ5_9STRA|nr:conserved hypothetical protein [Albugo laibachii Nc14]CCA23714.1 conserved hypothetical protein [Albugo laibachii Nc14]|eukprot:CCA23714.1 conserved hypothetical protein [Albugo laibachii Nc14]
MPWRFFRMEDHFERIRANFIRCEKCNEDFFFDYLRHPRYFVTHFKTCHLKNLLYRFNGFSEEENQKIRFGPRRKRDAHAWFGQLKSTEKRMISMQDNKWSEILERACWSCRLCNDGKLDLTHVFELSDYGRVQAFLHLRQCHDKVYQAFLQSLPTITPEQYRTTQLSSSTFDTHSIPPHPQPVTFNTPHTTTRLRTCEERLAEAERSRLRRLRATFEEKQHEALRSKKRREAMTPAQRHADYERRKRKKRLLFEAERSKQRREQANEEMRLKEVIRSRARRKNATEEQRRKEALRSRKRRANATQEQKEKERERCRKRYEEKKKLRSVGNGLWNEFGGLDTSGLAIV